MMVNVNLKVDGLCCCVKSILYLCVCLTNCICVMLLEKSLDAMKVYSFFSKETLLLCCYIADRIQFNISCNAWSSLFWDSLVYI